METKELKIQIPEGCEIDRERSTFEKIVFKKKDTKPRSWEEYLCSGNHPNKLWFIHPAYKSNGGINSTIGDIKDCDLNKSNCYMGAYLPSKELTKAFLAMMQLMSIRQEWIRDWKPCWDGKTIYYCIVRYNNGYTINGCAQCCHALSFPTEEMAEEFMNCFRDLLEVAKPLI